jgi:hypothetical protein
LALHVNGGGKISTMPLLEPTCSRMQHNPLRPLNTRTHGMKSCHYARINSGSLIGEKSGAMEQPYSNFSKASIVKSNVANCGADSRSTLVLPHLSRRAAFCPIHARLLTSDFLFALVRSNGSFDDHLTFEDLWNRYMPP